MRCAIFCHHNEPITCCGSSPPSRTSRGLVALMLVQHARAPARFDVDGEAVPLDAEDPALWGGAMIAGGVAVVEKGMRHRRPGPSEIQAAIAALHAQRAFFERHRPSAGNA